MSLFLPTQKRGNQPEEGMNPHRHAQQAKLEVELRLGQAYHRSPRRKLRPKVPYARRAVSLEWPASTPILETPRGSANLSAKEAMPSAAHSRPPPNGPGRDRFAQKSIPPSWPPTLQPTVFLCQFGLASPEIMSFAVRYLAILSILIGQEAHFQSVRMGIKGKLVRPLPGASRDHAHGVPRRKL